ncbi:hypothetical protein KIPB_011261, partial [Kipferlia bialata]|eukprot:g11261.t1
MKAVSNTSLGEAEIVRQDSHVVTECLGPDGVVVSPDVDCMGLSGGDGVGMADKPSHSVSPEAGLARLQGVDVTPVDYPESGYAPRPGTAAEASDAVGLEAVGLQRLPSDVEGTGKGSPSSARSDGEVSATKSTSQDVSLSVSLTLSVSGESSGPEGSNGPNMHFRSVRDAILHHRAAQQQVCTRRQMKDLIQNSCEITELIAAQAPSDVHQYVAEDEMFLRLVKFAREIVSVYTPID